MMGGFGGCCGGGWFGSLNSFGWIGFVINILILITLAIGLVLLFVWVIRLIRGFASNGFPQSSVEFAHKSPKEVLDIRYAQGEITRDEYQTMTSDLG